MSTSSTRFYLQNFGILLAAVVGVTTVLWFIVSLRDEGWFDAAIKGLGGGIGLGLLFLPLIFLGWAVYLPLVVMFTRYTDEAWKARLVAIALSPVNTGILFLVLREIRPGWEVVVYMILVGVAYGCLVRLPRTRTEHMDRGVV